MKRNLLLPAIAVLAFFIASSEKDDMSPIGSAHGPMHNLRYCEVVLAFMDSVGLSAEVYNSL